MSIHTSSPGPGASPFEPNDYDLTGYLRRYDLGQEWVSIRDGTYSPESCHPTNSGRYHCSGQPTYYSASGLETARRELNIPSGEGIPDKYDLFAFPPGEYHLFDARCFINDHPEVGQFLTGTDYCSTQKLRAALESVDCSGIIYPSAKHPGGQNASIWPLDGSPFPSGSFFRHL